MPGVDTWQRALAMAAAVTVAAALAACAGDAARQPARTPESVQADIQTLAVVETARRRGLARTLVQTLIGEARDRGARELFLEVRVDNPNAQSLYDSLGFERIAVRKGYYQPDNVDGVVMRLEIATPVTSLAVGQ